MQPSGCAEIFDKQTNKRRSNGYTERGAEGIWRIQSKVGQQNSAAVAAGPVITQQNSETQRTIYQKESLLVLFQLEGPFFRSTAFSLTLGQM
jgi:6-phosphogluconate dehydrogenase (decarboxylating)